MTTKRDYHVVPNSDRGGWDVKREGAERASDLSRKEDAMERGRRLPRERRLNLSSTDGTGKFRTATATETIRTLRKIPNHDPAGLSPNMHT